MTTTVRSVTTRLDADVNTYIAKMRLAGNETDKAFDRAQVGARGTTRELGGVERGLGAVDARAVTLGRDMRALDRDTKAVDRSINQLTGRLRLIADLAATVGPAAIPLGAGAVGGIAALTAQVGAAAAGIGVGVLAVQGLGDGLDALNAYQLEPTQDNLAALNEEFRKLGPDGQQFLLYLDSLEPKLRSVQMAARGGFLPGAQEGIDELLTTLPQVRDYVADVSQVLGELSADAGADLVSDDWAPFFDYVRSDGIQLLDQFARSLGNTGQGVANLLAAFGPATGDFSGGLLDLTERFADWSTGLDGNDDFQAFLEYVRTNGPQVVDFLGSFVTSVAAVVEAGAPLGEVTLPAITGLLDVLTALAGSDLGTPLLATAAGLAALNRATTGIQRAGQSNFIQANYVKPVRDLRAAAPTLGQVGTYFYRLGQDADQASKRTLAARESVRGFARETAGLGRGAALLTGVAVAASGAADSVGLTNTMSLALMGTIAGPAGAAVGGFIGLTMDLTASQEDLADAILRAKDAMNEGDSSEMAASLADLRKRLAEVDEQARSNGLADWWRTTTAAGIAFGGGAEKLRAGLSKLFGEAKDGEQVVADLESRLSNQAGLRSLIGVPAGIAREFDVATQSVDEFAASFADLQNLLDTSGSLVNYERALDDLAASMKASGSFNAGIEAGRKNIEGLNDVTTRAIERSEALKKAGDDLGAVRILRRAREDLLDFGRENESAMRWVRPLVDELDNLSSVRAKPTIDADDKPLRGKVTDAERQLARVQARIAEATITGDNAALNRAVAASRRLLDELDGDTATTYIRTVRVNAGGGGSGMGPQPTGSADGATVPKTGRGYADRHLYLLADGEEVISNRYGQADRHRGLLKDINAGRRLADGGTTGDEDDEDEDELTKAERQARARRRRRRSIFRAYDRFSVRPGQGASGVRDELDDLRDALKDAKVKWSDAMGENARALTKQARRYDRLSEELENAREAQAAYREQVAGSINNDIFGNGLAGLQLQLEADRNDNQAMLAAIREAEARGLDGGLAQALYASGDLTTAQQISQLSAAGIAQLEQLYGQRAGAQQALGQFAGNEIYGQQIRSLEQRLARQDERFENQVIKFLQTLPGIIQGAVETGSRTGTREGNEGRGKKAAQIAQIN